MREFGETITIEEFEKILLIRLLDNPNLRLPNADEFVIEESKYTAYLFGGTTEIGLIKGRLIDKILGYNITNYKLFDRKIKDAVKIFPATLKETNEFGNRYEIYVVIEGLKDRKAVVLISAQYDIVNTHLVTAYIKNVKGVK